MIESYLYGMAPIIIVNGAEPDGLSIAQIMKNIPEGTTEAFRFPGTVITGTAWRQEKSCRLFCFY